jgi:tetratricopeptide (TPR) repeat protein
MEGIAMKPFLIVSVTLALAVSVSAQNAGISRLSAQQSTTYSSASASPDAQMTQASLYMVHKQYAEAAAVYQQMLKKSPNDASLWNHLGIAYHQQSLLNQALKCYEKATKYDKANGDSWNNIGTVYYQEKKYPKAIRAYKKAIGVDTKNAIFYSNIGMAYLDHKEFPEAMTAFQQALQLDPAVFDHSGNSGTVLQDRSVTDHGLFYFLLAKSFASTGNVERCAYYLKKARDENYADIATAKTDPVFSRMLLDPKVRDILGMPELPPVPPKSQGV